MANLEGNLVDLSQPLASLLQKVTKKVHDEVNSSPGAQLLLNGELSKAQYTQYLMMLWHIYDTLERALERHAEHPTLKPTHNPALLGRTASLASDISFFLQVPQTEWQARPATSLASMPPQLRDYVDRINAISNSTDPSALLAHSYVRYLGDLSGGQSMRRVIAKAYDLDETSGLGVEFYEFKALGSSVKANIGDMKKIKEWFREGMNAGGQEEQVKAALVNETEFAFNLNAGILQVIETLAAEDKKSALESNLPAEVEKSYPLASVAAFIAAACLAHFFIVVGGLTGAKGCQALLSLEHYVSADSFNVLRRRFAQYTLGL